MTNIGPPSVLSEALLQAIAAVGGTRRYPARTIIISEGDQTDSLYVVLSGRVKVFTSDPAGRELTIATHGRGEYVGEMALDGLARSASVTTVEAAQLSVIRGANVRALIGTHPDFALNLIHKLIWRARQATIGMTSLAFEDVHGRVLRILEAHSTPFEDHRLIRERMTHRDIAERIGASPDMVGRVMKNLAAQGFLSIESGRIKLFRSSSPP